MKNIISLLLFVLLLVGCAGSEEDPQQPQNEPPVIEWIYLSTEFMDHVRIFHFGENAFVNFKAVDPDINITTLQLDLYDVYNPDDIRTFTVNLTQVAPSQVYKAGMMTITESYKHFKACFFLIDSGGAESLEHCFKIRTVE